MMVLNKTTKMYNVLTGEEFRVADNTEHVIDNDTFVVIVDKAKKRFLRMSKSALSTKRPIVNGVTGR